MCMFIYSFMKKINSVNNLVTLSLQDDDADVIFSPLVPPQAADVRPFLSVLSPQGCTYSVCSSSSRGSNLREVTSRQASNTIHLTIRVFRKICGVRFGLHGTFSQRIFATNRFRFLKNINIKPKVFHIQPGEAKNNKKKVFQKLPNIGPDLSFHGKFHSCNFAKSITEFPQNYK